MTDVKGLPHLTDKHLELLKYAFDYQVQVIISGQSEKIENFKEYIETVYENLTPLCEEEYFTQPYYDYLQQPLQPLMMNLENQTYDIFEKDPIKYDLYQEAVFQALKDSKKSEPVIYVLGSGRGGIVKRVLRAAKSANKKIKLFAVEKNPNAIAM
jgi:type II protein arginine methyltransferase